MRSNFTASRRTAAFKSSTLKSSRRTRLVVAFAQLAALASLVMLVRVQTAVAAPIDDLPASAICSGAYLLPTEESRCSKMPCTEKSVNSFSKKYESEVQKKMALFCANPGSATSAKKVANRYFDACRETGDLHASDGHYLGPEDSKKFKRDWLRHCARTYDFMIAYLHGAATGGRAIASSGTPKVETKKGPTSKKALAGKKK